MGEESSQFLILITDKLIMTTTDMIDENKSIEGKSFSTVSKINSDVMLAILMSCNGSRIFLGDVTLYICSTVSPSAACCFSLMQQLG